MKQSFLILLTLISVFVCYAFSCDREDDNNIENYKRMVNEKIKITVNNQTFTATLLDNSSAKAFKGMLPLTIKMKELNGNEKYYDFANNLPANSSNPRMIKNGDLMLYGSKTLVLFYESFSTSYSYTKLGTIDDVTGLASAIGTGNVTVTFELE
jgi:hypothetical protein